jgi:hypothetical protein
VSTAPTSPAWPARSSVRGVSDKLRDLVGYDVGTVAAVVKTGLTGNVPYIADAAGQKSLEQTESRPSADPEPSPFE